MEIKRKNFRNVVGTKLTDYIADELKKIYDFGFKLKFNLNELTGNMIFEFSTPSNEDDDFNYIIFLPYLGKNEGTNQQVYFELIEEQMKKLHEEYDKYNLEHKTNDLFDSGSSFKNFKG